MKKIVAMLLTAAMLFTLAACGSTNIAGRSENTNVPQSSSVSESSDVPETAPLRSPETPDASDIVPDADASGEAKILIAYFSRAGENYNVGVIEKGNTAILAEMIAEQTGGDLFHIETTTPYPETYQECTDVAQQELRDNARPALSATVDNFADYEVIFLGYPIWWSDMPMAVYTFLESYDFGEKTIVPFATHEGSGLASTESSIKNACSGAAVLDGLALCGAVAQNEQEEAKDAVTNWLRGAGFVE